MGTRPGFPYRRRIEKSAPTALSSGGATAKSSRRRLLVGCGAEPGSFIATHRVEGVLLLSADRHRHDVWQIPRPNAYPLFEFESSKITNVHTHPTMKQALFSYNGRGFGLLLFDTTVPDPVCTCQIIGEQSQVVHTFQVRRSQLRFPQS